MQTRTNDVDDVKDYFMGLVAKNDSPVSNNNKVILTVAGAVMWRKHSSPFKSMEQDRDSKYVLWLCTKKQRYAVLYLHDEGVIEVREGSLEGEVRGTFNNKTPNEHIYDVIVGL
jgi:hypothetical protein